MIPGRSANAGPTLHGFKHRIGSAARNARVRAVLQVVAVVVALWFAARALSGQWAETRAVASQVHPDWTWILLASAIVLGTHASLIQAWRMLLAGWDVAPAFWTSARIWTVSNLGRYIPLKVWSIVALNVLATRAGVSGVAAAGAAIIGTLLNLGAGFGIIGLSGSRVLRVLGPWMHAAALVLATAFIVGVLLLPRLLPALVQWISARRGLSRAERPLSASRLWTVTVINALAWVGYGVAFAAFSRGVTPQVAGATAAFITVYTASYLAGYLVLLVPGGIGVREAALVSMLVALGMAGAPEAAVLALASRVWITVLEIAPGLIALLLTPRGTRSALQRAE